MSKKVAVVVIHSMGSHKKVKKEWHWWCNLERAYAQIDVNVINLVRV